MTSCLAITVLATLSACGRIGFEPVDAPAGGDGSPIGDGGATGDVAPATACANAIAVTPGTPLLIDTCSTGQDLLDGCGPPGTREVVLVFVAPASSGYTVRARDPGTENVTTPTGIVDATCAQTAQCAGIIGRSYTAGQQAYFALEASSGTCVTVEFEVL